VPTDPYVAPALDELPRQAQNVAPGVNVPPAGAWTTGRPGDEVAYGQPRGMLLGSPGPNVGYALTLVHRVRDRLVVAPGEHVDDAASVVGELGMRRAASYGRAPVMPDLECSMLVLGYQGGCPADFASWRSRVVEGAHHDYPRRRALCDGVPIDELRLPPAVLATRVEDVRSTLRSAVDAAPV
jgi:hypothetical protein